MDNQNPVLLSETKGLDNQLRENLCGPDGREWLESYKTFMKKMPTWTISKEIVKKQNLHKGNVITLAAANGSISLLFSENKTGKDKQHHWNNFKNLISEVPYIEVPEMKVQSFTLKESMNDSEIRDELGGNDKLCFKSKTEALRVLGSTTTDAYRDGKATMVYYLDEEGELCCAYCDWVAGSAEWGCDADRSRNNRWLVGDRVLYPAT